MGETRSCNNIETAAGTETGRHTELGPFETRQDRHGENSCKQLPEVNGDVPSLRGPHEILHQRINQRKVPARRIARPTHSRHTAESFDREPLVLQKARVGQFVQVQGAAAAVQTELLQNSLRVSKVAAAERKRAACASGIAIRCEHYLLNGGQRQSCR
jgi:hypothetical protein